MKILYVSQYFPPEMGAPAARVHDLSREWVRQGHEVTVLTTFPHHPTGVLAGRDRGVIVRRERTDGIDVLRVWMHAAPNRGVVRRMASYVSFMLSAATLGRLGVRRADVVLATSPQLLCAAAGYAIARTLHAPFVFEVRDLWPESILAVEAMGEGPLIRLLRGLAAHLYAHADRVVVVGGGYRRQIHERYGLDLSDIDVVPNGIDRERFVPGPREGSVRRRHGWEDRFVVMYVGAHGMAHALGKVLEAAEALREEEEILFVFVGDGAEKSALQRRAEERRLPNVVFVGQQGREEIPAYYAACDLGLVPLRATPLFQAVLPSKIFECLGMERPVLISVDGEARRLVEESGGGRFVPPEDAPAMAAAICEMARRRDELESMGRRGRDYVLRHFDRRVLALKYVEILREVIRKGDRHA